MFEGDLLEELRKDSQMTQKELADKIGVSKAAMSRYELNQSEPSIDTLSRLAETFGVSIDYLCGQTKLRYSLLDLEKMAQEKGLSFSDLFNHLLSLSPQRREKILSDLEDSYKLEQLEAAAKKKK